MPKKDIEILDILTLRGPNIWTYRPVLEAWIDIGELENFPSNLIPGFPERLETWLPSLIEHRCSYGERGGFLRRLHEGTWPGHILEHVTLELQNLAGLPGGFGKAREAFREGVYKVVVRAWHEDVTRTALLAARDLVMAAIEDRPYDVAAAVTELRALTDAKCLGPSTACIVDAADDLDIPAIRLTEGNLVQLGYGARQRRIWTAETDRTGAIAESVSRDKDLTKSLLSACGVPVPEGRLVGTLEEAYEAADDIGMPVVVKPTDGNHGRGVFTNLTSREEIAAAWQVAIEEGSGVLVERFIPGHEHRLLVVGGKVVAAARGDIATVTGDGVSTIRALIESQINSDPRRGSTEDHPLNPIRIDSSARLELKRQGHDADSIPPAGKTVLIQRSGNMSHDVTDLVHPDVAAHAVLAARIVGLDIAGIDLVAEDISQPLEPQRGAIVEVNAGPGLLMHLKPAVGTARPVGRAIVEHLFPNGDDGRIPVVGITGSTSTTAVARRVAHLLHLTGATVGLACRDGLFVNDRHIETGDCANWQSAHRTLLNRAVDAAVFENGPRTILSEGLAYDRCQVAVVTDLDPTDMLPEFSIVEPDQMFNVFRTQVDVVLKSGYAVLNADDEQVADMARLSDGEVVFFSTRSDNPLITAYLASGGRAVFPRDGKIVLAHGLDAGSNTNPRDIVLDHGDTPLTISVLASLGAAWVLGVSPQLLSAGIRTDNALQAVAELA